MARLFKVTGLPAAEVARLIETVAAPALHSGQLVAVPTDTLYGLACVAQSSAAVRQLYAIKGRDLGKPVAICVSTLDEIPKWAKCSHLTAAGKLMEELLPGPVTVVLERTKELNPELNPNTKLVGVRVPDQPFIRELVRSCSQPIALTSANKSGKQSPIKTEEFRELWDQLAAVFDAGNLSESESSKIIPAASAVSVSNSKGGDGSGAGAAVENGTGNIGGTTAVDGDVGDGAECAERSQEERSDSDAKRLRLDTGQGEGGGGGGGSGGSSGGGGGEASEEKAETETQTAKGSVTTNGNGKVKDRESAATARKGSTVVDLSVEGQYRIIRPGTGYEQTVATLSKYGLVEAFKA